MANWLWEHVFPITFWASLLRPGNIQTGGGEHS